MATGKPLGDQKDRTAFFRRGADETFVGNDPARGPWSPEHCHAGPVTGLVARAAEREVGPGKMLTRLTLDVLRPVPLSGFRVAAETVRHTRTLATTRVEVHGLDGTRCVSATTMHLARRALGEVPTPKLSGPEYEGAVPARFPIRSASHDLPAFTDRVEVAFPAGQGSAPGPKTVWMRTPPLLDDEDPSPVQMLCPLADCGNGISWNAPPEEMGFMNTDLSVHIHREPVSDWLASQAVSHWHSNGCGMSQAVLFDREGPVATALQTLVLFPPR